MNNKMIRKKWTEYYCHGRRGNVALYGGYVRHFDERNSDRTTLNGSKYYKYNKF